MVPSRGVRGSVCNGLEANSYPIQSLKKHVILYNLDIVSLKNLI